jgi:hypothetical protein
MAPNLHTLRLSILALLSFTTVLTSAASGQEPLKSPEESRGYNLGEPIPVSCLNRTIDTGEHITDASGHLQYIPFPSCAETSAPLSLSYGTEHDINCTIPFISDSFFNQQEF